MKKFAFLATLVAVVGAASVTYAFSQKNQKDLSDIQLTAIEVLSNDDAPEGGSGACYDAIHGDPASIVFYCPTCSWIENSAGDGIRSVCGR